MARTKYSTVDTKSLSSNIMDLRGEAFQEINGVDLLLGCQDITAVLYLESNELTDLKKNM